MVLFLCILCIIGLHIWIFYDKEEGVRIGPWVIIRPSGGAKEGFYLEVLDENNNVKNKYMVPKVRRQGITIGRSKSADIQISLDPTVGKKHAVLGKDKKGYFLLDRNSKNGMFNAKNPDKRVEQISVNIDSDDVYLLSKTRIRFSYREYEELESFEEDWESLED